jgi:hypothetical protein
MNEHVTERERPRVRAKQDDPVRTDATPEPIKGGVHQPIKHDSGHKHVTGQAIYTDDIPTPASTLHAYLGLSTCAHGSIEAMDLSAVRSSARCRRRAHQPRHAGLQRHLADPSAR